MMDNKEMMITQISNQKEQTLISKTFNPLKYYSNEKKKIIKVEKERDRETTSELKCIQPYKKFLKCNFENYY